MSIVWPWLKSPIIIQSRLLTSLIALCIFSFSSMLMFGLRYTNPTVNVEFPVTMLHQTASSHSAHFSNVIS
ncbi:hypothetical protein NP493_1152g00024 [Ridgeia piscesae]|uniref:Uncharacterized protein n=1 Tax=Ridgeia piscesae TaxID=27915 RepID=A0AAD9NKG2_RIDPI|nr:hypothetical protein NP493_1152g00024 [Ridgeia piscesae]